MKALIHQMQNAMKTRAAYRRTASEIRNLPLDVALDLDVDRADANRIARQSVFGY